MKYFPFITFLFGVLWSILLVILPLKKSNQTQVSLNSKETSSQIKFAEVKFSQLEKARYELENSEIVFGAMPLIKETLVPEQSKIESSVKGLNGNSMSGADETDKQFTFPWKLSGIISAKKGNKAVLSHGDDTAVVVSGEIIDGWKVVSITTSEVRVISGKETVYLRIFNKPKDAKKNIIETSTSDKIDTSAISIYENRRNIENFGPVKRDKAWKDILN